jgi:hypothetical protein
MRTRTLSRQDQNKFSGSRSFIDLAPDLVR